MRITLRLRGGTGGPWTPLDSLRAWATRPALRGTWRWRLDRREGDWPFEALCPMDPRDAPGVFRSAAARAREHLLRCLREGGPAGATPRLLDCRSPVGAPSGLRRAVGHLVAPTDEWRLALLERQGLRRTLKLLDPSPDVLRADPFVMDAHPDPWIFFEQQERGRPGTLHVARLSSAALHDVSGPLLPSASHQSWPCVFLADGSYWMLPETGEEREVALWRATDFPYRWTRVRTLLTGEAFHDPCPIQHEGVWWLFVGVGGAHLGDHSAEARLYRLGGLAEGAVVPHPANPISLGVGTSRPAGLPWLDAGGRWIRPIQDCRGGYGRCISLRRILQLDAGLFRDREVARVELPAGTTRMHTLSRQGGRWVCDVRLNRRAPPRSRDSGNCGP